MATFLRIGNDMVNTAAIAGITFAEVGTATLYLLMPIGDHQQIELTAEQVAVLSAWLSKDDRIIDLDHAPEEAKAFALPFHAATGGRRSAFTLSKGPKK